MKFLSNRFFSIRNINEVRTEESDEFFFARLCVLSTQPNSHKVLITRDILMRDGNSVRGKWIVANPRDGEFMSHDENEFIVGIVPTDARIDYVDDEDGYTYMYVDAVLSKIYAKSIYDMFKSRNFRNVSVEMMTADRETLEDGSIPIDGLKIYGITILGNYINGSNPSAHMQIVQFSDVNAESYYKTFSESESNNSADDSQNNKEFNNMEEKTKAMSEEEKEMAEVEPKDDEKEMSEQPKEEKDMAEKTDDENTESKTEDDKSDEKEMAEPTKDEPKEDEKEMSEDSDKDDDDNVAEEDDDKDFACLDGVEKDMSEEVRNVFACGKEFAVKSVLSMATELKELRKFKADIEQKEKEFAIDNVMANVKSVLTEKEFSDFRAEGLACDNVDAFTNKVKAFAYDRKQENSETVDNGGIMEFACPTEKVEHKELTADDIFNRYI